MPGATRGNQRSILFRVQEAVVGEPISWLDWLLTKIALVGDDQELEIPADDGRPRKLCDP
jgi:hypothetical protein